MTNQNSAVSTVPSSAVDANFEAFMRDMRSRLMRRNMGNYVQDEKLRDSAYGKLIDRASGNQMRVEVIAVVLACHVNDFVRNICERVISEFSSMMEGNPNARRLVVITTARMAKFTKPSENTDSVVSFTESPEAQAARAAREAKRKANQETRANASLHKGPSPAVDKAWGRKKN